jgi:hypothetical protein
MSAVIQPEILSATLRVAFLQKGQILIFREDFFACFETLDISPDPPGKIEHPLD